MNSHVLIEQTIAFVQKSLKDAEGGHDWWHIHRVHQLSKEIAKRENANLLVVELGALLHDIADSKFHNGDEELGPIRTQAYLMDMGVEQSIIEEVVNIVRFISFKGGREEVHNRSKAFDVVQDADRLDALGAIGIARVFSYGGFKGNAIYDPTVKPRVGMSKEEYKKGAGTSINHFYEKLLLLKDLMNTKTGRELAEQRHNFMEKYLAQFYAECKLEELSGGLR